MAFKKPCLAFECAVCTWGWACRERGPVTQTPGQVVEPSGRSKHGGHVHFPTNGEGCGTTVPGQTLQWVIGCPRETVGKDGAGMWGHSTSLLQMPEWQHYPGKCPLWRWTGLVERGGDKRTGGVAGDACSEAELSDTPTYTRALCPPTWACSAWVRQGSQLMISGPLREWPGASLAGDATLGGSQQQEVTPSQSSWGGDGRVCILCSWVCPLPALGSGNCHG